MAKRAPHRNRPRTKAVPGAAVAPGGADAGAGSRTSEADEARARYRKRRSREANPDAMAGILGALPAEVVNLIDRCFREAEREYRGTKPLSAWEPLPAWAQTGVRGLQMLMQDGCGPPPGFEETWSWWTNPLTIPQLLADPPMPFFHGAFEAARQRRRSLAEVRDEPRRVPPGKRLLHAEQFLRQGRFLLPRSDLVTRGCVEFGENLLTSWERAVATLRGAREANPPEKLVPRGFLTGVRQLWARHPELGTLDEEDLTDLALAVGFEGEPRLTRRKLLKRWKGRLRQQGW